MSEKTVAIIGAGIAGLTAGIYARLNGYSAVIYEMHNAPGGLCAAWKRGDYVFDGCVHWLVGSRQGTAMNRWWREVGLGELRMIDHDTFMVIEGKKGEKFTVFEDAEKLRAEMLRLAPGDRAAIEEFTGVIKQFAAMPDGPPEEKPGLLAVAKGFLGFLPILLKMAKYSRMTDVQFAKKFKDPFLRFAFGQMFYGIKDFSLLAVMFTLAWMHAKNAGYPMGGSLAIAKAMEKRFITLGGEINYGCRVEKIMTDNGVAEGVALMNGDEKRADYVISAADGYSTIFRMLGERFSDNRIREIYDEFPLFPSICQASFGVNMDLKGEPQALDFPLDNPVEAGPVKLERLCVRIISFDNTVAPQGKCVVTCVLPGDYAYWTGLRNDDLKAYAAAKKKILADLTAALDGRFPGFMDRVEASDLATPATYERYTGNWKASFEGWAPTPRTLMAKIPRRLPGLKKFYMAGQWVQAGGGLPTALQTGREAIAAICKEDGKRFTAPV